MAFSSMPMNRTFRPGWTSSGSPVWCEVTQHRQLAQVVGDNMDLGVPVHSDLDPTVTHRIVRPAVHPERPARGLHPRQHPQQPARRDFLHLWLGLGRRRQITGGIRRQSELRTLTILRLLTIRTDSH